MLNIFSENPKKRFFQILTLLIFLTIIPIFTVKILPFADFSNNMGRYYIVHQLPFNETLQNIYSLEWKAYPYVLLDIIFPPLLNFFSVYLAGKVILILSMSLYLVSVILINRHFYKDWGLWPLFTFLIIYNHFSDWFLINNLFGGGLALLTFALWLRCRNLKTWQRLLIFTTLSFAIYLSHLIAFMFYAGTVVTYDLWFYANRKNLKQWFIHLIPTLIQLIPPVILYLTMETINKSTYEVENIKRIQIFWEALPVVNNTYFEWSASFILGSLALYSLWKGYLVIEHGIAYVIVFWILFVATVPMEIDFITRFPFMVYFLGFAGVQFTTKASKKQISNALTLLVILVTMRSGEFIYDWGKINVIYQDFMQAISSIPKGSALLPVYSTGNDKSYPNYLWHLSEFAVIEKDAFVPQMFTSKSHQVLRVTKKYEDVDLNTFFEAIPLKYLTHKSLPIFKKIEMEWDDKFDYFIFIGPNSNENPFPTKLELIDSKEKFSVYKIKKPN